MQGTWVWSLGWGDWASQVAHWWRTQAGDIGLISGSRRSPREGNGSPLQYSCLGNPMDRGARWATVPEVAKSRTWLSNERAAAPAAEKIPHAVGHLSLCATTTKARCTLNPGLCNKRSHCNDKLAHCNWRVAPVTAIKESPQAATKIHHSQKVKK